VEGRERLLHGGVDNRTVDFDGDFFEHGGAVGLVDI
jgi:hypothetical protein